jgi:hypothetical protein
LQFDNDGLKSVFFSHFGYFAFAQYRFSIYDFRVGIIAGGGLYREKENARSGKAGAGTN